jgi:hypothetical protein
MADFGVTEILAAVGTAATVAGGLTNAAAARQQAAAQQQALQYQAAVARNNQTIAEQNAQAELEKGQALEAEKRREIASREGAIRAAVGGAGLDTGSGSPLRLQEDTARLGELDAQTIRNNSERAAYGFRTQGMSYAAQAQLDEMGATSAARGGALGAFSSILGRAASVSDKWLSYRRQGIPGPWSS